MVSWATGYECPHGSVALFIVALLQHVAESHGHEQGWLSLMVCEDAGAGFARDRKSWVPPDVLFLLEKRLFWGQYKENPLCFCEGVPKNIREQQQQKETTITFMP